MNVKNRMPAATLAAITTAFSFLSLYILDINHSSMTTIGAVINPAMYTWLKLLYTSANECAIEYIKMYMEMNDKTIMPTSRT